MKKYLIVIDMQNDFIDGALGSPEATAIVPRVQKRIEEALAEGRAVLFTQDTHHADYLETSEGRHLPVPHCVEGTPGFEIHEALAPYATKTIRKPTFGFTGLADSLRDSETEPDGKNLDIALCGLCTDICVVSNALILRAQFPEAVIRLYPESCAGTTPEKHNAAIAVMQSCQIDMQE